MKAPSGEKENMFGLEVLNICLEVKKTKGVGMGGEKL